MTASITESKQVLLMRFPEQVASKRSSLSDWCYVTNKTGSQYGVCIMQLIFFLQNTEIHSFSTIKLECQSLGAARSKARDCGTRLLGFKFESRLSPVRGVLSGRGLVVGLITPPEEAYRVWCV